MYNTYNIFNYYTSSKFINMIIISHYITIYTLKQSKCHHLFIICYFITIIISKRKYLLDTYEMETIYIIKLTLPISCLALFNLY